MAERDRLRALQVRVAGHHCLGLRLGEREEDERERVDRLARLRAGVEHVRRNAAATWSFRDRPAWIFRPTSPSSRSIALCTSSSESR